MRLTGVIARIVMDKWAEKFRKTMKEGKVEEFLLEKYVDDVNIVTQILEEGWSWKVKKGRKEETDFFWSQEQVIRDREEGMTKEERTLERLREVASKLVPGIIFTAYSPGRHSSGKVPMLDVCVWKEGVDMEGRKGTLIRHGFFEKPSASPTVFHGRGATSTRSRIITLHCIYCRYQNCIHGFISVHIVHRFCAAKIYWVHFEIHSMLLYE